MRRNLDFSFFLSSIPLSLQPLNTFGILNENWKSFVYFGNYKKHVPKGLLCGTSELQVQRFRSETIDRQKCIAKLQMTPILRLSLEGSVSTVPLIYFIDRRETANVEQLMSEIDSVSRRQIGVHDVWRFFHQTSTSKQTKHIPRRH